MAKPAFHKKVKLIIGFIFRDTDILCKAKKAIMRKIGSADLESGVFRFDNTDYYKKKLVHKYNVLKRNNRQFQEHIMDQPLKHNELKYLQL